MRIKWINSRNLIVIFEQDSWLSMIIHLTKISKSLKCALSQRNNNNIKHKQKRDHQGDKNKNICIVVMRCLALAFPTSHLRFRVAASALNVCILRIIHITHAYTNRKCSKQCCREIEFPQHAENTNAKVQWKIVNSQNN